MARQEEPTKHGGKRLGAGRKPTRGARMVSMDITVPEELAEKAGRIGGGNRSEGCRLALEAWNEAGDNPSVQG